MDAIREDSVLASEMVALLGRELKAVKAQNKGLEKELQDEKLSHEAEIERAEAAEAAMRALTLNIEKTSKENQALRAELDQRIGLVKKEELPNSSLPRIEDVLEQSEQLQRKLAFIKEELDAERRERQRLDLAFSNLEYQNEQLQDAKKKIVEILEGTPITDRIHNEVEIPQKDHSKKPAINGGRTVPLWRMTKKVIDLLRKLFAELPKLSSGLVVHGVAPVGPRSMVLNLQLVSNEHLHRWQQSLLYVPHLMTATRYGLAFFPAVIFKNGHWTDAVSDHVGQVREVFCTSRVHHNTIYSGTYSCHLPPPDWFGKSDILLSSSIDLARTQITKFMNDEGLNSPPQLYDNGVLIIKYLALRYVGFDEGIPDELSKTNEILSIPPKRKADELTLESRKKSKV